MRVDGIYQILQEPAITGLIEVEQLHFTGGIEKIVCVDVVVNQTILPRSLRNVTQPCDMALDKPRTLSGTTPR